VDVLTISAKGYLCQVAELAAVGGDPCVLGSWRTCPGGEDRHRARLRAAMVPPLGNFKPPDVYERRDREDSGPEAHGWRTEQERCGLGQAKAPRRNPQECAREGRGRVGQWGAWGGWVTHRAAKK